MASPAPNSVGWYILEGYPWWPVFVCDQFKLRPKLHFLGDGHRSILKKARDFPKHFAVVYYFGSHEFSLVRLKNGVLRPWDCSEKDTYVKGHPKHLTKKKAVMDDLTVSIQEAEDYLAQPEDMRLPPHMVPSDLDPTLEPPPEIQREEEDEPMDDADGDASDGEDGADSDAGNDEDHPEDENEEASDGEGKKKKREKKDKKEKKKDKKKDKKAVSKEKKTKKTPSSKDKKKASSKSKESKASSTASPSATAKTKDGSNGTKSSPAKKRKKPTDSEAGADKEGQASPAKVPKTETGSDIKDGNAETKEAAESRGDSAVASADADEKKPEEPLSGDALTEKLETEIRWILLNCQFEEMTTKTVRKLLEKRLKMDLRHHKASIKEGVARVIDSMEDGMDGGSNSNAENDGSAVKTEPAAGDAAPPNNPTEPDIAVREEKAEVQPTLEVKEEPKREEVPVAQTPIEPSVEDQLAAAAKALSAVPLSDDQILEALTALGSIPSVSQDLLVQSKLAPRLQELYTHKTDAISSKVISLTKQWKAEAVIAPVKEVDDGRLLELKAKLENSETPHDEICSSLDELAAMPLQMSHLKNSKISRVVSDMRQHANDKVSTKANSLRRAWMRLAKDKPENAEMVRTLTKMNQILEQRIDDADKAESVQNAQLDTLEKLHSMSLRTQDIIVSKIGVSVSKLRKSSDEKVAKAAVRLRKKWKKEAGAA